MKPEDLTPDEVKAFFQQAGAPGGTPFPSLGAGSEPGPANENNLRLLMDVMLDITVELGRTRRPIRDILGWGPGAVVELDRVAGEAVDLLVNGRLVARGEVVVIGESYGVRITQILEPAARLSVSR